MLSSICQTMLPQSSAERKIIVITLLSSDRKRRNPLLKNLKVPTLGSAHRKPSVPCRVGVRVAKDELAPPHPLCRDRKPLVVADHHQPPPQPSGQPRAGMASRRRLPGASRCGDRGEWNHGRSQPRTRKQAGRATNARLQDGADRQPLVASGTSPEDAGTGIHAAPAA